MDFALGLHYLTFGQAVLGLRICADDILYCLGDDDVSYKRIFASAYGPVLFTTIYEYYLLHSRFHWCTFRIRKYSPTDRDYHLKYGLRCHHDVP
jgi:hypothetical protein